MPSFVDIAPLHETVTLRGLEFPVHGIGIDTLADVIYRFPQLGNLLPTAVAPGTEPPPIDAMAIIALGPQIVAALIAAATGKSGDPAEEKALAAMAIGDQLLFVDAIIRISFPGGLLPFVNMITGLLLGPADRALAAGGRAPASSSSLPSTS